MSSLKVKLDYLNGTKHLIAEALKNNGVDITDTDTFRSYADKITELNTFKPLDICDITIDAASVLDTTRIYFYKQNKDYSYINSDRSYDLTCHNYSQKLGIYAASFDNDNIHINGRFLVASAYESEYITIFLSDNNWHLKTKNVQSKFYFIRDKGDMFYNNSELSTIHPFLADRGLTEINKEIKIQFDINKLKISDLFTTEIGDDKDVIIFLFNDGEKYIYVFPSKEYITFTNDATGYIFKQTSYMYPVSRFIGRLDEDSWFDKTIVSYDETTGARDLVIDQHVLISTKDIYDEDGNLLFNKNATISDFI